jgi:hypothetical protein
MMVIVAAIPFTAQYGYDVLGRKTGMVDPDMGTGITRPTALPLPLRRDRPR